MEGLVVWSKAHREALEQRYTLNRQLGTPTDMNIRLAQEDIWLLGNLAKVIRKTNEERGRRHRRADQAYRLA